MIRICGALLIFFAVSATGVFLSDKIKEKKERIIKEIRMLSEISDMIRWNVMTLSEIIHKLYNNGYSDFEFVKILYSNIEKIRSFPIAWQESVNETGSFSKEEKRIFSEIGSSLGTTDKEGQISTLDFYINCLNKSAEEETEKYKIKGKMYRSLGIAAGAMIGIIII